MEWENNINRVVFQCVQLLTLWFFLLIPFLDVLDGAMIVLAIYTMNFAHPGVLLHHSPRQHSQEGLSLKEV
jgi:hypothetical protein